MDAFITILIFLAGLGAWYIASELNKESESLNLVDLSNCDINQRLNVPIHLRLLKFKSDNKEDSDFINWRLKHENKLSVSYQDYFKNVLPVSYSEYCYRFYSGTLEGVFKSSYVGLFKKAG